mmetsp:Transcript_18752/g.31583  ORF Transcript_18752/g.31583 Transcript_18752/m.31583 type:complete len:335 (+) Transcript_18752:60-1064(+)|eukprot:CAMPEP_0175009518 /NCGR_PEP_ID=MMETSP0005-20121125/7595_1 /TAXON_ID=420556 /ORGANISM="Ochromonas sp., Strain CCMP1393" /LENGTH=334 /DNA_ID=CAMNT_0016265247 /DNA_START=2233 /DNA_END=3237 /DNA_ORIENTATION=-
MGLTDKELGFVLVVAAGMSTGIGAAVVYSQTLIRATSKEVLASALGLAAGVMFYVSLVEILFKSIGSFEDAGHNENDAYLYATLCFFGGIVAMKLIDWLVHLMDPDHMNHDDVDFDMIEDVAKRSIDQTGTGDLTPDESAGLGLTNIKSEVEGEAGDLTAGEAAEQAIKHAADVERKRDETDVKLHRMGLMTALAIAIHNFPEGLATFVATLNDPAVGAALAIAIAIHNIPEGLCVSVPIYFATNNRHRAFGWGVLSGVSEIIGAGLGWIILEDVVDNNVYAILFGVVAGMMINICLYQLLPTAMRYDPKDQYVSNFVVIGMAIMAMSLVVFLY